MPPKHLGMMYALVKHGTRFDFVRGLKYWSHSCSWEHWNSDKQFDGIITDPRTNINARCSLMAESVCLPSRRRGSIPTFRSTHAGVA